MTLEVEKKTKTIASNEKNIFVIDDDDDLREIIELILINEGYNVFMYSDPLLALSDYHSLLNLPDLIILDFFVGKMNGGEFLLQKKKVENEIAKNCPVLMISGSLDEVKKNIDPILFKEVLEKPLSLDKLILTVKNLINTSL